MRVLAAPIAYNEEKKIGSVLERFKGVAVDRLVLLDDASTDRTPEIGRQMGAVVLRHEKHQGVGAGIRTVLKYSIKEGFDITVILAGNDKDRPVEIERLTKPIREEGYDLVQGSRYLPGGNYGNMPLYRQISTRMIHPWLLSFFVGKRMTDTTNGFRAIRNTILNDQRIQLDQDWLNQYELEPYLLMKAIKLGYKVKEVPVTKIYPPKALGYTKMKPIVGWWSILKPIFVVGLGIRR